jgi:hypothetical protein
MAFGYLFGAHGFDARPRREGCAFDKTPCNQIPALSWGDLCESHYSSVAGKSINIARLKRRVLQSNDNPESASTCGLSSEGIENT